MTECRFLKTNRYSGTVFFLAPEAVQSRNDFTDERYSRQQTYTCSNAERGRIVEPITKRESGKNSGLVPRVKGESRSEDEGNEIVECAGGDHVNKRLVLSWRRIVR